MSAREIRFSGGVRTVLWFVVAFTLVLLVWIPIDAGAVGPSLPSWADLASDIAMFAVLAGVTLLVLRREGVSPAALGLAPRLVAPGVLAFGAAWAGLNLLGAGVAVATGEPWGVDRIHRPVFDPVVPTLLFQFLVVGMVEEFTVRGYLQSKLIALLGDAGRSRIALGIVSASLVFGLFHVPGALLAGASPTILLLVVAARTGTGIAFGLLYELTGNVYFVGLLHGLGNTWPLVVDWWAWSGEPYVAFWIGLAAIYLAVALGYRHWMRESTWTPVVRREDAVTLRS